MTISPCTVAKRQQKCSAMQLPLDLSQMKLRGERLDVNRMLLLLQQLRFDTSRNVCQQMTKLRNLLPSASDGKLQQNLQHMLLMLKGSGRRAPSHLEHMLLCRSHRARGVSNCLIDGMFSCMCCGYILFSSKRSERTLRIYQQRVDFLAQRSSQANVKINADPLLSHWRGDDIDDRAFVTWEAEQLRKGRQCLTRSMKLGCYNVLHRYRRDNEFASSLANIKRDITDCIMYDMYAVLRLAGIERTAGQRAIGTGPMDRVHKHDRIDVAKVCFATVPNRLLHDEFRDPHRDWLIFWRHKPFTIIRFAQDLRQANFSMITMLTFSQARKGSQISSWKAWMLNREGTCSNVTLINTSRLRRISATCLSRTPEVKGSKTLCWRGLNSNVRMRRLHLQMTHLKKPFLVIMSAYL